MIRASAPKALGEGSFVLVKMDPCQDITGGCLSTLHRNWLSHSKNTNLHKFLSPTKSSIIYLQT